MEIVWGKCYRCKRPIPILLFTVFSTVENVTVWHFPALLFLESLFPYGDAISLQDYYFIVSGGKFK